VADIDRYLTTLERQTDRVRFRRRADGKTPQVPVYGPGSGRQRAIKERIVLPFEIDTVIATGSEQRRNQQLLQTVTL